VFKGYPNIDLLGVDAFPVRLSSDEKFALYYTAPVITVDDYNIVIFGESEKWTRVSPQRISHIINYGFFLLIELDGVPNEAISFSAMAWRDGEPEKLLAQEITFGPSMKATIKIENGRISLTDF